MYFLLCILLVYLKINYCLCQTDANQTQSILCGVNEHPSDCVPCDENCIQGEIYCIQACFQGCKCNDGYLRENGVCIPKKQCKIPTCPGPNERPTACVPCAEDCDRTDLYCKKKCEIGCKCEHGYLRLNGKCIPEDKCPVPKCTGPHEMPTNCIPCDENCQPKNEICPLICIRGCKCKPGYLRENGVCLSERRCPLPVCPNPNEIGTNCVPCEEGCIIKGYQCLVCNRGCKCKCGFARINGQCLPRSQCPVCNGPNEEPTDCAPCEENCVPTGKVCAAVCRDGCQCKPDFLRNSKGVCIPKKECPAK